MFRPQGREVNILEDKFERNYAQNKNFHNILTSIKFGHHNLIFFNFYFVIWCHGLNRSFYSEISLKQRSRKISKYHNAMFIMLRVTIEPAVFFIIKFFIKRCVPRIEKCKIVPSRVRNQYDLGIEWQRKLISWF